MKKKISIILTNILFLVILAIIAEGCLFHSEYIHVRNNASPDEKNVLNKFINRYKQEFSHPIFYEEFRNPVGTEYKDKPAILLLGCSITFGYKLAEENSFQTILSDSIKRTVYNFSVVAGSPRELLYILRNKDIIYNTIDYKNRNNIEYVIYTYITDHKRRLLSDIYKRSPKFKVTNNGKNLVYAKSYPYENLYLYRKINNYIADKNFTNKQTFKLLCLYLKEIKAQSDILFNNSGKETKFVVLIYEDYDSINAYHDWEILESYGIKVINLKDILGYDLSTNSQYRISETDFHPNRNSWEIVVPIVIKELNLE